MTLAFPKRNPKEGKSVIRLSLARRKFGDAQHGGVSIYSLGNEPALWDDTHHDFHPQPTTYDELWTKSRDLAQAVKGADPGAATLGPAEWGWPNYFCSAADHVQQGCSASSPDRAAHGGTELSAWYLQQFAAHERQTGRRLLDGLDGSRPFELVSSRTFGNGTTEVELARPS